MIANHDNMLLTFDTCNMEYFEGKLLFPQFGLLHSYRTLGYFHYNKGGWFDKNVYDPIISITDYYDFTPKQFENIMVHEMIHYYLAYTGDDRQCRHGKSFRRMAEKLNKEHHLNIAKTTDVSKYKLRKGTSTLLYRLCTLI